MRLAEKQFTDSSEREIKLIEGGGALLSTFCGIYYHKSECFGHYFFFHLHCLCQWLRIQWESNLFRQFLEFVFSRSFYHYYSCYKIGWHIIFQVFGVLSVLNFDVSFSSNFLNQTISENCIRVWGSLEGPESYSRYV